ncbi:3-phosphoshikimate 1-carboxyvinyltransferase [Aeromicrobium duanguangcaii]|uniref:3-phosphoshikimate 1-carboxyvinyltransferase n=1 Tax=Aeromicrobium duanguangcaii TaxID=2968086 RepID=A0ABY5KD28_9ACTN|nr:3-phosphoshikimate 1-carboxyvinyltransferase [Aeromicrobium duanguangcaii]MCD9154886.1 3-phosphoshikimate 1-carboxyvinyltransferase [Aeromicrobium duanguangcaii]UUI67704.1 3-phosphoshikimate 1-carboxyvinyltransferase [Aeromicrobium duanguangcaii]
MTDWRAPRVAGAVQSDVLLPGSKSQTNRALVLAAISDGPSVVRLPLVARDTELMASALASLGARLDRDADQWTIEPITPVESAAVDCGLAGTVMRFVPPVAALGTGPVRFDGDPRARERPMGTTISSLRDLGVQVDDDGRSTLPFTVHGAGEVRGGSLTVDASASSQFVSALLLVAPRFREGLDLRHEGGSLPSLPHVAMTVTELRRRGVVVDESPGRWQVHPGPVKALDVTIEPDLSNAGPFVAAALATAGRVRVRHWPEQTDQAGDAWRDLAVAFGGTAERDGDDLVFTGPDRLRGVDLDLHDVGELTPVVAALAALADTPSTLTGIAHLRGHETDRLAALATEINRLGGRVDEREDGLVISPAPLHGGSFATYEDHRMAHAGAVIGLRVDDVTVENIGTTAKTYPGFADDWMRAVS